MVEVELLTSLVEVNVGPATEDVVLLYTDAEAVVDKLVVVLEAASTEVECIVEVELLILLAEVDDGPAAEEVTLFTDGEAVVDTLETEEGEASVCRAEELVVVFEAARTEAD